jgi:hypothetical protein
MFSMEPELRQLVESAKHHRMTPAELEAQTESWVFGNGNIENSDVTREVVRESPRRSSRVARPA